MSSKIIVIGNGFDLAAGAKTSYANYFESDFYKETKEKAIKWINYCLAGNYRESSLAVLYEDDPSPFNCWDLLFCMKSSHIDRLNCYSSIRNWCDIEQVIHESLPILQEYLQIRKKAMGLETLHMYDLYASMVEDYEMKLPYEEAFELVLQGLQPMGADYLAKLREAREGGWIDVYPNAGKSSGAFSAGDLTEVHPYVLLNHNNNLDSAFTIAHELGHSMHSFYSNTNQPFPKNDYSLFVAEVASTCNECVMLRYLLQTMTEKKAQAYLLNHFLEQFRTTCFRQTMFAEFEKISHEMAAEGTPLTKESLSEKYYELNKTYYGESCEVDPEIAAEWMRIPHFYRAFYVYVYATGLCAAVSLSEKILNEGESAVRAYRQFLSAGCSVPPIEALKLAGIDMSRPEPLRKAMEVFRETVDKMKEVIG